MVCAGDTSQMMDRVDLDSDAADSEEEEEEHAANKEEEEEEEEDETEFMVSG